MFDGLGDGGGVGFGNISPAALQRWNSTRCHMNEQDEVLRAIDERIYHDIETVERQRVLQHEILLSHLLGLLERKFILSERLVCRLEDCDSHTLARLFIPGCRARDEEAFIEALEALLDAR